MDLSSVGKAFARLNCRLEKSAQCKCPKKKHRLLHITFTMNIAVVGIKHLPSSVQMDQSTGWKSRLFLILSIGSRPCSGAILVLFLSYTLNIYLWGVLATLMMAVGTGITLTFFALIAVFARHKAVQLKVWYLPARFNFPVVSSLKFLTACVLIGMGILLLHGSFIEVVTVTIFRRNTFFYSTFFSYNSPSQAVRFCKRLSKFYRLLFPVVREPPT